MKEIKLPCGKVAFVSDEDWPLVSQLSWYDRNGGYPAARHKKSVGGNGKIVSLHHFIVGHPTGDLVIDHIDGNTLNNQRENLQVITNSRNMMKSSRALAGGLHYRYGRWHARLRVDGSIVRLGAFAHKADAQAMLDAARKHAWGPEFNKGDARLASS